MFGMVNDEGKSNQRIRNLIDSGAEIAGGAVGGALGFLAGGSIGAALLGAGGAVAARTLKHIGNEVSERLLGKIGVIYGSAASQTRKR